MTTKSSKNALVPVLRFPEFLKDEPWKPKRISDIGNVVTGNTPSTKKREYYNGPNHFVSPADISDLRFVEKTNTTLTCIGFEQTRKIPANSTLFVCIGSTIGKVAQNAEKCATNQQINSVIPKSSICHGFVYYCLNWHSGAIASIAGNQAVPIINKSLFSSFELSVPKTTEQKKIADCLGSLDDLIAAHSAKLDALQDHKKGLLQQLFPAEGETTPKLRFPEFLDTGEWEVARFEGVIEIIDGDRGVNYPKANEFSSSEYCLFLNAKNVTKAGFRFEEQQFVTKEKDEALRKGKLKRSDIVLTTRGTVGQFAYYSNDVPYANIRINSGMVILRSKTKSLAPDYFYAFTKSEALNAYIKNIAFGNAQQQLTVGEIKKFRICYPKPAEQEKISDCLSNLDSLITCQTEQIDALKELKKGLMQQLFPNPELSKA